MSAVAVAPCRTVGLEHQIASAFDHSANPAVVVAIVAVAGRCRMVWGYITAVPAVMPAAIGAGTGIGNVEIELRDQGYSRRSVRDRID